MPSLPALTEFYFSLANLGLKICISQRCIAVKTDIQSVTLVQIPSQIVHLFYLPQIVAGLAYLHDQNILHRDVKDENIILDHQFHLKLIDFGSAAYMEPGKLFNTFCGTLEYCSPEVLLGNSYSGPELEMWALGVTLYTLVFGENPFFEVEETISGHLQPPYLTSPALMKIIFWLLHPDPRSRATLKDLLKDKWVNQPVDMTQYSFDLVMGYTHSGSTVQKRVTEKVSSVDSENLDSSARKLQLEEQVQVSEGSLHDE